MYFSEIEAQVLELQGKTKALSSDTAQEERVGLGLQGGFDDVIYEPNASKFAGYDTSIAATDEQDVRIYF